MELSRIKPFLYERPDIQAADMKCDICNKPGRFVVFEFGRLVNRGKVLCEDCDPWSEAFQRKILGKPYESKRTNSRS